MIQKFKAKLTKLSCTNQDWSILSCKKASCVLPISVGNRNQEKDKLLATLEMVSNRFSCCDLILADTLQRYNLPSCNQVRDSKESARSLGDCWLNENKKSLDRLTIPFDFIRWDSCLNHPDFKIKLSKVKRLSLENAGYHQALKYDASVFLSRCKKNGKDSLLMTEEDRFNYLIEETAVLLSFFFGKKYKFILYPGDIPSSVKYFLNNFLHKEYPDLLSPLKIYFKNISN